MATQLLVATALLGLAVALPVAKPEAMDLHLRAGETDSPPVSGHFTVVGKDFKTGETWTKDGTTWSDDHRWGEGVRVTILQADIDPDNAGEHVQGELLQDGILWPDWRWNMIRTYADPNHDGAERKVLFQNGTVLITGKDSAEGDEWSLGGTFKDEALLVDFSPKGGPKDLKGSISADGITWPDGNTWAMIRTYADPNHDGAERKLFVQKGKKIITGKDSDDGPIWTLEVSKHSVNSPRLEELLVDFSPKGGPKDLQGVITEDGITWPDGNKWGLVQIYADPGDNNAERKVIFKQ